MLLVVAAVCLLPVAAVGLALRREWRAGLRERLGVLPATPPGVPAVWIHGASVGEISALAPVARMLRAEFPEYRLIVSTSTYGGRVAAATRVPQVEARVLLPLDLPWTAARGVRLLAPRLVLFSETEIWPNFLHALASRRVPAVMVSGRLSERAFRRYRRCRWLFAPALATVRWFCVQSRDTARRLVELGAPPERVVVTGSLKATTFAPPVGALTLEALGVTDHPVLVAGSTHPGEEEAIIDAWPHVISGAVDALLVIAPRRPERFDEVGALLARRGVSFIRRSALPRGANGGWPAGVSVLLLDTLGELAGLYPGARAAFVGGTLAPVGGHNLLEPAASGVPVLFGPSLENVRAEALKLVGGGGGLRVRDAEELGKSLGELFADAERANEMGRCARATVEESEGPLVATLAIVRGTLMALATSGAEDGR